MIEKNDGRIFSLLNEKENSDGHEGAEQNIDGKEHDIEDSNFSSY